MKEIKVQLICQSLRSGDGLLYSLNKSTSGKLVLFLSEQEQISKQGVATFHQLCVRLIPSAAGNV